jgi:CheY-specific phosphatase CheX
MTTKKILSSIYENTKSVLKTMTGIKASLEKIEPITRETQPDDYCILVGVTGAWNCVVVFSFDLKTGLALASRLTRKAEEDFSEEGESALCELTNIIMGNALNSLDGTGFHGNLTLPTFAKGGKLSFFMPTAPMANLIIMEIEVGTLKIFVSSKNS